MVKEKNKKSLPFSSALTIKMTPEKKRIFQYMLLVFLLVTLLCIGLWKVIVAPANKIRFEEATSELLESQKNSIIDFKVSFQKELAKQAQSDQVLLLLENIRKQNSETNKNLLSELQDKIRNSLPNTKQVNIYFPLQAQQEKDSGGAIGFIELDMINRAEENTVVHPEVAKVKGASEWEIHWVESIYKKRDKQQPQTLPIAILYVSTPLSGLEQAISNYDHQFARIQLLQTIGKQRQLRFLTLGAGGGHGSKISDVPFTHWQVEITPSSLMYRKVSYLPFWLILLIAGTLAVGLWTAYKIAKRKNAQQAALYKALDTTTEKTSGSSQKTGQDTPSAELNDPLYLSDQHLILEEADTALIDGTHQEKKHDSSSKKKKEPIQKQSTGTGLEVPSHIFRAYDIRGIVDEELTPAIAEAIGKAVATEALEQGQTALILGHDARTHSPKFYEHVKQGIISTGCDVILAGLVPTPLLNFAAIFSDQTSSGIIVTASHNPKNYNGFKIVINENSLVEDDIQRLQQRIASGALTQGNTGQVFEENFAEDYIDTILSDIAINSDLHLVVDAANGAASELAPALFDELGCQVTPLFCDFDGEFPNHDPDPSIEENLTALKEKVVSENADIGIALDGDGDRLVVVTSSGKIIWPDQLLMLFARDVVSRNPGCDVIFDIKSTRQLNQVVSSYGGRPVMWKTGHSHIKAKMRETEALLAGEYSGHIFFKERWFGFDDGIYAAARLLEIMSLRDQSLDDMFDALPTLAATPEIKIPIAEDKKFALVDKLIKQGDFASGEKTTIDGLRIDFDKGWGLVRASNTAPALTLRFEAQNENGIEQLKTLFKRELRKIDQSLPLDF